MKNRTYYSVEMMLDEQFMQFPKWLMLDPEFSKLSNDAKILYINLKDRFKLSVKNHWLDKEGRVYVICKRESMCVLLHKTEKTVRKIISELKECGLIDEVKNGLNKPNYIYLLMPNVIYDEPKFEEDEYSEWTGNFSRSEQGNFTGPMDGEILPPNNNESSNEKDNKNNFSNNKQDVVDYINSVIDAANLTENEVGELANKKQKDLKTLERYKNASFNVSYFMQSWANQKFHDEVVYKYDLPKEEYLQKKTPCDRAEEMILDTLCLKRYKLTTLDALNDREIRELFDTALGILEGEIYVAKTPEAYLIGVIDNMLKAYNNRFLLWKDQFKIKYNFSGEKFYIIKI